MIVLEYKEYKLVAAEEQRRGMDEVIRTTQFVRNACLRYWMDSKDSEKGVGRYDISKHTTKLRAEFEWAQKLNLIAVQAAGERARASIARFYDHHKKRSSVLCYAALQVMSAVLTKQTSSNWPPSLKQESHPFSRVECQTVGGLRHLTFFSSPF